VPSVSVVLARLPVSPRGAPGMTKTDTTLLCRGPAFPAGPPASGMQIFGDRSPRRVGVDHALSLPLLGTQRLLSRARRFAVGGGAVQIRGGSVILDPLTAGFAGSVVLANALVGGRGT
jgi:hypothetical protein